MQKHSTISIQPDDTYWIGAKSVELGPILALGVVGNESPGSDQLFSEVLPVCPPPSPARRTPKSTAGMVKTVELMQFMPRAFVVREL